MRAEGELKTKKAIECIALLVSEVSAKLSPDAGARLYGVKKIVSVYKLIKSNAQSLTNKLNTDIE